MSLESMKVDLSGQNAIVTGASQGLGRAMAVALGASGARVALVARNAEKLAETAKLITDAGGQADVMAADISNKDEIEKIVATVADEWGKLDILVKGGGEKEGDEPFERTRGFTIDELTAGVFALRAVVGPADKPIVLTYKAQRLPAPGE